MTKKLIMLNKPGLYVAEHNPTGNQYLVSITGELPMLRVANILDLSKFVLGVTETINTIDKLKADMQQAPNEYTYTLLQTKLVKQSEVIKEDILDLSKYSSLNTNKEELLKMDDNMAIITICKDEDLNMATATEIWKQFKLSLRS